MNMLNKIKGLVHIMDLLTKDLLINFLFILLSLFLLQMIYLFKYVYRLEESKRLAIAVFHCDFYCVMYVSSC